MKIYFHIILYLFLICNSVLADFSFIVFGDWGKGGRYFQTDVGSQMAEWSEKNNAKFIISTGDNFYNDGVQSTEDSSWTLSFENIYWQQSLFIPWYVTLGNHDYHGIVQAQIDYSKMSNRWNMPSRYYSQTFLVDDSTTALFVFLDTSPLALSDPEAKKFTENVFKFDNKVQLRWLDSILSSSKAQWKFVSGHHPVYSGGYHGGQIEMQKLIKPILEKNNVQAYFCGHDHDMQYLKSGKINYIVSGAGAKPRVCEDTEFTYFYMGGTAGFFAATLTSKKLYGAFIDSEGNQLYKLAFGR